MMSTDEQDDNHTSTLTLTLTATTTTAASSSGQTSSHKNSLRTDDSNQKGGEVKKQKIIKWDEETIAEHDKERGTR